MQISRKLLPNFGVSYNKTNRPTEPIGVVLEFPLQYQKLGFYDENNE